MDEFKRVDAKGGRASDLKGMSGTYSMRRKRNVKYDRAVEVQCMGWEDSNNFQNI